ncbi:MAG: tRNA lysidine(34) synthetase TilS [Bacteroidetes bacterium]|nr:tRNA lysidine(34) synthetase TilS [Bacteroidota bacterium]
MAVPFAQHVAEFMSRYQMCSPGQRVLCTVSGGKDSVVMAHVLQHLGHPLAIAHVNFGLRGLESDEDALFVAELAQKMEVPHAQLRLDTLSEARPGESIQMTARRLRYHWFQKVAKELGCSKIATAHTANDNVETLIYRLLKGTGLQGMTGIPPTNGDIVRPLLDCTTEQVLEYAKEHGLCYRTDSSNLSDKYARNYLRNNILPLFDTINPSWPNTMRQHAHRWHEIALAYHHYLDIDIHRHFTWNPTGYYSCDLPAIRGQAHGHNLLMESLIPLGFSPGQVDDVWKAKAGGHWQALKYALFLHGNTLLIGPYTHKPTYEQRIDLRMGGKAETGNGTLTWRLGSGDDRALLKEPGYALMPTHKLPDNMVLAQPKKGQRFNPYGMKGSQLLSDYLTNSKHNPIEKAQVYVLSTSERIAWIVGQRIDRYFSLDHGDDSFVVFRWDKKSQTPFGLGRGAVVSNV